MDDARPAPPDEPGMLTKALRLAGSDAARYLPVRFVPALASLITVPLFTRAIGAADYGAFHVMNAFLVLGARVAAESIGVAAIRFYWPSKKAGTLSHYIATVVWSVVAALGLAALLIAAVAYLGRGYIDPLVMRLVPVAIAYFFLNYALYVYMEVLRAANRASDFVQLSIGATILTNVFAILFAVVLGWGSAGIFAGVAAGSLIMVPLALRRIAAEGSVAPTAVSRDLLREFGSFAMPLVPAGAALWALGFLDRFVIEWARGTAEVGLYSIAYGLGEKIMQLMTLPLILTMTPVLIKTFEENGQRTAERMQTQFTRYFALVTVPLLAGIAVISRDFMTVFTAAEYREAYPVLAVIATSTLLFGLLQVGITGLTIHKQSRRIMSNMLVATAFNLALNVALVPRFGYYAAAWNVVAAYGLLLLLTWLRSRQFMRWHIPWASLVPVFAATAVMAAAVWAVTALMPTSIVALAAEGLTGVVVYSAALVAFKGVRPDERAWVREMAEAGKRKLRRR